MDAVLIKKCASEHWKLNTTLRCAIGCVAWSLDKTRQDRRAMGALGSVAAHEDMIPTRLDSRSSRAGRPEYSAGSGEPRAGTLAPRPRGPNAPKSAPIKPSNTPRTSSSAKQVSMIFVTGSRGVVTLTVLSVVVLRVRKVALAMKLSHARSLSQSGKTIVFSAK